MGERPLIYDQTIDSEGRDLFTLNLKRFNAGLRTSGGKGDFPTAPADSTRRHG